MKLLIAESVINQQEGDESKCYMIWQMIDGYVAFKEAAEVREVWRET